MRRLRESVNEILLSRLYGVTRQDLLPEKWLISVIPENMSSISGLDSVDPLCSAFRRQRGQEAQRVMPPRMRMRPRLLPGRPNHKPHFMLFATFLQFFLARQFVRPPVFPILGWGSIWVNEHSR